MLLDLSFFLWNTQGDVRKTLSLIFFHIMKVNCDRKKEVKLVWNNMKVRK